MLADGIGGVSVAVVNNCVDVCVATDTCTGDVTHELMQLLLGTLVGY